MVSAIQQQELATGVHVSLHPEPPSILPPDPSGLSQGTSFECPASRMRFLRIKTYIYLKLFSKYVLDLS